MSEEWRAVPGFPAYEVSSEGRVRRCAPSRSPNCRPGEVLQGAKGRYLSVKLFADGIGKKVSVHRVVCEAFHGPPPTPDHQVAHWDGNRENNRASNLRWATARENCSDRERHGRTRRLEAHARSRLTAKQVEHLRAIRSSGGNVSEAAREMGVHHNTALLAAAGQTWSHLP